MAGINYKSKYFENLYQEDTKCIFISHQKADSSAAKQIADYLLTAGINVYFDEYDNTLELTNPYSVVNGIRNGLRHSTHVLVLLSENALKSKWIPWEVGYAYDSKQVISLTLKEISTTQLPEYLQITTIIRGTKSLNELISTLLHTTESNLIYEQKMFSASIPSHPLDNILNWQL